MHARAVFLPTSRRAGSVFVLDLERHTSLVTPVGPELDGQLEPQPLPQPYPNPTPNPNTNPSPNPNPNRRNPTPNPTPKQVGLKLDGSLGLRGPRTQWLWVLYELTLSKVVDEGKVLSMEMCGWKPEAGELGPQALT